MLILTRKNNQIININDDIEIIVLASKNNQVKIGIKAPKEISVHRNEIYKRIKEGK